MSDTATVALPGSALTPAELRAVDEVRAVLAEDPACRHLEAEVARRLRLSPHTVHHQLQAARAKLGVRRNWQLVWD
jgi:DNA-binding NarL/FixJ family response regulator